MKVEIWSDFICPYCYIGKRRFESALSEFPYKEQMEVIYRSFELDPHAEKDQHTDIHGALARKFHISYEQAKSMNENVGRLARDVGLTYRFEKMIPTNTFDAHRLMHFAKAHGRMKEMVEILFRSYFTDGKHIGDREVLARLAEEAGLNREEALRALHSDQYVQDVRADEAEANRFGIQGVPFYVINRKYAVSGAQSQDLFLQALNQAWKDEQGLTILNSDDVQSHEANSCHDGVCRTDQ